jgi:hypothetical protein
LKTGFQVAEAGDVVTHRVVADDLDRFAESAVQIKGASEGIDKGGIVTALDFLGPLARGLVPSHSRSPPAARNRRNAALALRRVERTVAGSMPSSAAISAGVAPS